MYAVHMLSHLADDLRSVSCLTASTYDPSPRTDSKLVIVINIRTGLSCLGNGDVNKDTKPNQILI
jgi:hypothetical protein